MHSDSVGSTIKFSRQVGNLITGNRCEARSRHEHIAVGTAAEEGWVLLEIPMCCFGPRRRLVSEVRQELPIYILDTLGQVRPICQH